MIDGGATLGPPQDAERPVEPPERAAAHWKKAVEGVRMRGTL